jgi:predicted nucleic acid-binding Zn ribbon protein
MAKYEYACDNSHVYIDERPMTEDDKVVGSECEICTRELKRVYSSAAAIFKGKGFYSTGG